jgi:1-acyl-sn-glycerol-3-phosphate acyltransferase
VPGLGLQKNLKKAREIILQKGNIVIYPEGKIAVDHDIAPFHSGAAVLATETGTPVIPVSLRPGERKFFRKELIVNIGEPMHVLPDAKTDDTVKLFYDSIVGLYNR